jgi:hypothetical protein
LSGLATIFGICLFLLASGPLEDEENAHSLGCVTAILGIAGVAFSLTSFGLGDRANGTTLLLVILALVAIPLCGMISGGG